MQGDAVMLSAAGEKVEGDWLLAPDSLTAKMTLVTLTDEGSEGKPGALPVIPEGLPLSRVAAGTPTVTSNPNPNFFVKPLTPFRAKPLVGKAGKAGKVIKKGKVSTMVKQKYRGYTRLEWIRHWSSFTDDQWAAWAMASGYSRYTRAEWLNHFKQFDKADWYQALDGPWFR